MEPLEATAVAAAAAVPGSGPGSSLDLVVLRPVCLVSGYLSWVTACPILNAKTWMNNTKGSGPRSGLDPARTRVHPGLLGWSYNALLAWVTDCQTDC